MMKDTLYKLLKTYELILFPQVLREESRTRCLKKLASLNFFRKHLIENDLFLLTKMCFTLS